MRITRRDLDTSIIEKLDQLDTVVSSYDENSPDGYVSYNKAGFYFKKIDNTSSKKVYTEDEIVDLEAGLYNPKANINSSKYKDMRLDKSKFHVATKSFLQELSIENKIASEDVINIFQTGTRLALLFKSGKITFISSDWSIIDIDFLNNIKSQFALSSDIGPYDIVDIKEIQEKDIIFIATRNYGVYKVESNGGLQYSLITNIEDVRSLEITVPGALFISANSGCGFYDITTGLRIERALNIYKSMQLPVQSIITESGDIMVMSLPLGNTNVDNILHGWKLDTARVAYNAIDSKLPRNPVDKRYQIMYLRSNGNTILVTGLFNGRVFIWKYDITNMSFSEKILNIELAHYTDALLANNNLIILSDDKIYVILEDGSYTEYKLKSSGKRILMYNGQLLLLSSNGLYEFELPGYSTKTEQLSYQILNMTERCNNIDICVLGATRAERISIIDLDTNKEIIPSYYMVYGSKAVIKLMNCESLNIKMNISVSSTSNISGIVAKQNRIFLR